jgi:hypothetical protein
MKHALTFSVWSLLLLAVVVSCKKDDPAPTSSALIGNWQFVSVAATGCTDPTDNFVETCTTDCGTLAITATGWTFTQPGTTTDSGTYTVSGNTVTLSETGGSTDTYTYAIVSNVLTFTKAPGGDGCLEVSTFSKI